MPKKKLRAQIRFFCFPIIFVFEVNFRRGTNAKGSKNDNASEEATTSVFAPSRPKTRIEI